MADDERESASAANALLGVPTGEGSLSRDEVEELEFSAKQRSRPQGVTRHDYLKGKPGDETRTIMAIAGVAPQRRLAAAIAILLGSLAAVGVAAAWLLLC